jgi:protein required for attachment to host cells
MKNKPKIWLVVADGARAHVRSVERSESRLVLAKESDLETEIEAGRALTTDRPGRSFDSQGPGRHGVEPSTDPRANEKRNFLRTVAAHLDRRLDAGAFDKIVLVAAPAALGVLRNELSKRVGARVEREIANELIGLTDHELVSHLENELNKLI